MLLSRRFLVSDEQPFALATQLQRATILSSDEVLLHPSKVLIYAQHAFRLRVPIGIPHGVMNAIVLARDLYVEWSWTKRQPRIYFCNSADYRAVAETLLGGDSKPYPNPEETLISSACHIPWQEGFYPARLRVRLNGRPNIHIEKFCYELATPQLASI
jgi:hypothetical protein